MALAAVLVFALFSGCAAPRKAEIPPPPPPKPQPVLVAIGPNADFCLLPQAGGKVGSVVVTNAKGSRVLTRANESLSVKSKDDAPSEPVILSDMEVKNRFGAALDALPPPPAHFILYFQKDKPDLTDESKPLVEKIAQSIRERAGADVSIVGHTDTTGDRQKNFTLGLNRAKMMLELLKNQGLELSEAQVASHGQDNPLIPTGPSVDEPRNRRVEISVR